MRLGHARATTLSLLAGGFLMLGMLAVWSSIALAGSLRPVTTTAATTTAVTTTDTSCQVLPSSGTTSPSPSPSPAVPDDLAVALPVAVPDDLAVALSVAVRDPFRVPVSH